MSNDKERIEEKLTPVPLSIMTGQGNTFKTAIINKSWVEEIKTYTIRGIPLSMVTEFFNDKISIDSQIFNFKDESARAIQNKWLPLIIAKDKKGLTLEDISKEEWDTKNLRELWKAVLDLSGF